MQHFPSLLARTPMCPFICICIYTVHTPPRGPPPYRGEEVCASQWHGDLCWRECKPLVGPTMPGRSKDRGQNNCSPWSSRLGVECGAITLPSFIAISTTLFIRYDPSHGTHYRTHRKDGIQLTAVM
jgi:hypothetical protein